MGKTKDITVTNTYVSPRDTTSPHYNTVDTDTTYCIRNVTNTPDSILTGDVNAHSTLWYSHTDDHRGQLISDIISNSEHITLNTDTPTRVPHTTQQQATSPDITTISVTLYNRTTWHTIHALNSDHLPIITTISTRTKYKQNRHTFTNYRKANWTQFLQTPRLPSLTFYHHQTYTLQTSFSTQTNTTSQKAKHRNNIRAQNASDSSISEITSLIQTHKYDICREHLDTHYHNHNTHTLWKTIHGLANKIPTQPKNNTITFKEKTLTSPTQIANAFNKQFINIVNYKINKTPREEHHYALFVKQNHTQHTYSTAQT